MKWPNFFIIGFPKCGTTSLAFYLSEHPQILISKIKEPHYFSSDMAGLRVHDIADEAAYLALFESADSYSAVGEASVGYVYSKIAVQRIREFNSDAKFIVIVRNPIDLAESEHAQMLKQGYEDVESFEEAWRLSDRRMQGAGLPAKPYEPLLLCYKEVGRVASYLSRVLEQVPAGMVKVILMDEMKEDMGQVYRDVLNFLDVADDGRQEFPQLNPRAYHRSKLMSRFINNPPPWLLGANRFVKRALGIEKTGLLAWLRSKNLQSKSRSLSSELRREMADHYADEVAGLERIIGRKVAWRDFK